MLTFDAVFIRISNPNALNIRIYKSLYSVRSDSVTGSFAWLIQEIRPITWCADYGLFVSIAAVFSKSVVISLSLGFLFSTIIAA